VRWALRAKRDVWGDGLLARPGGPTYAAAARYLHPLLFAQTANGPASASGVYYLPFGEPLGTHGALAVALHVADGSQILAGKSERRSLTVFVGPQGRERYGSCLARLTPARLADGYLPILDTAYTDASGVRYRQESFAGRVLGSTSLISFVRLDVDATASSTGARVRLVLSDRGLEDAGGRLVRGAETELLFDPEGRAGGSDVQYPVEPGQQLTIYAAWLLHPTPARAVQIGADAYAAARDQVAGFWQARLAQGAAFEVPDPRVLDAERSLLIQELTLTWRYSVGNVYQELSVPEALDAAEVMGSYGFTDVMRAMLAAAAAHMDGSYSNWRAGELLLGTAEYFRLSGDRPLVQRSTPRLERLVDRLARQLGRRDDHGLLEREQFSADVTESVYGLHAQAVVWQGLRAMSSVWARTGHPGLAATARRLSVRLGAGLRQAVHRSERRLPDGSLFVPAALLDGGKPFDAVTASRDGSYWNLVMPYALASGFFAPHGREARGILDYMLRHGSRLLGLVRSGGYSLYGHPAYPVSATDEVYGTNVVRFLADNDESAQLVLSLYGALGAAMTPNTFVSGEAASVAPLRGAYYRSMYLPPNGTSNASFLETLRLMLVHETRNASGAPAGLELAFATPRSWLRAGRTIAVNDAATSFGPLSYTLDASAGRIEASVEVPARTPPTLVLRLRLPVGERVRRVLVDGRPARFDPRGETVDLSGRRGSVSVVASVTPAR
jgi:hypothetical protein